MQWHYQYRRGKVSLKNRCRWSETFDDVQSPGTEKHLPYLKDFSFASHWDFYLPRTWEFNLPFSSAYAGTCALCRLKHRELLDAAHIIADSQPKGDPVVQNGICLCKIHHAAFDQNIVGVTPDYIVRVRSDILEEIDGPMLLHGLQGLHKNRLILPHRVSDRPDPERLEMRYNDFRKAG